MLQRRSALGTLAVLLLSARRADATTALTEPGAEWPVLAPAESGWGTQQLQQAGPGWQAAASMWWLPVRAWPFRQRAPGDVFFACGNHGRLMWADRARDLVIVHLTDDPALLRTPIDPERVTPLLERIIAAVPAWSPARARRC